MEYLTDTSDQKAEAATSERIKRMHRAVQKIKASEKWGWNICRNIISPYRIKQGASVFENILAQEANYACG